MAGHAGAVSRNPFYQPARLRSATFFGPVDELSALEDGVADLAFSTALFEVTEERWMLELLLEEEQLAELAGRMDRMGVEASLRKEMRVEPVQVRDWVSDMQANFPPIAEGRIYLHGSHLPPKPRPAVSLEIDAGQAFGTGEHATTAACLGALQALKRQRNFRRVLDLGCGTGVLGLAARKLWHASVVATDIDPVSVRVAEGNARRNGESGMVFRACAGFNHAGFAGERFDLIIANILARPLVMLAGEMKGHLAPGGWMLLSGLLVRQEKQVLAAYLARGMRLERRFRRREWSALLLRAI